MEINELLLAANNAGDFFRLYLETKNQTQRGFSLRVMSGKLGYANPSFVSEVLRGKRKASADLVNRFSAYQKMTALEQAYLNNMVSIGSSNSPMVRERKENENSTIREFWATKDTPFQPTGDPLDCVICATVLRTERIEQEALIAELGHLIEPDVLRKRIEILLAAGGLKLENGILSGSTTYRTLLTTQSYRSVLPVLERALTLENKNTRQLVLSVALTEENFKLAETLVRHAFEKIALLAIEEEKNATAPTERAMYTAYNSLFRSSASHHISETDANCLIQPVVVN
jgi:hypothetical protein